MPIDYTFNSEGLLIRALTHSSHSYENGLGAYSNERLEFLGDAVLELIISEELYTRYPDDSEGVLTRLRAGLVCEPSLAGRARLLGLDGMLLLGRGEEACGGRKKDSLLSDALEALIGAVYLDGGMDCAKRFVLGLLGDAIDKREGMQNDYKTHLQEALQKNGGEPVEYAIVGETGPDHEKIFTSRVSIGGKAYGTGEGRTKKEAEQRAARAALEKLRIH